MHTIELVFDGGVKSERGALPSKYLVSVNVCSDMHALSTRPVQTFLTLNMYDLSDFMAQWRIVFVNCDKTGWEQM